MIQPKIRLNNFTNVDKVKGTGKNMPRVKALRTNYMKTDAIKMFKIKLVENDMYQKDLAKVIDLKAPTFCQRFRKFNFSYEELVKMMNALHFTDEEILKLMKM